jgi:hypothetical protein
MHDRTAMLRNQTFEDKGIAQNSQWAPTRHVKPHHLGTAGGEKRLEPSSTRHHNGAMSISAKYIGEFDGPLVSGAGFDCRYHYQNG